ncbi:MAG: DUF1194 domain-containing protein [Methyloceanibacter sp.]
MAILTALPVSLATAFLPMTGSAGDTWALTHSTDANVATAIDISDSIGRHEEWLQKFGLTRALVSEDFLEAVRVGRWARIGFAVFSWSDDDRFEVLIPWTKISSGDDARRIAAQIQSLSLIEQSNYHDRDHGKEEPPAQGERLTDISGAIDFGSRILALAPFKADRSVLNVLANGVDNVGEGPEAARDRALTHGFTVNAVALSSAPDLTDYFRSCVIGGHGAFVLEFSDPRNVHEIMAKKFLLDLVAVF